MTKIVRTALVLGFALAIPAICHAVDTGSAAYRNGKTAGYVIGGLLLFLVAKRLLGGLAWARWLVIPGVAFAIWGLHTPGRVDLGDMSTEQMRALAATVEAGEVVMYTTTECGYCAQAKGWLSQNGFAFTECNMSVSGRCESEFKGYGGNGTPYLVVRGHHMKDGFDSDQFLALLKQ